MEVRHLRYFVAVVDSAGVSAAARRLRITQPALSRQIRDSRPSSGSGCSTGSGAGCA